MKSPVLVLNQNYEPLNICDVRRAVILLGRGKAEMLHNGRGELHTATLSLPIPSVIRLQYQVRRPFIYRRLSRREIFMRDHHLCCYCGKETRELTLDHVVPRHQGGRHTWDNVVSACIRCNHKKAGLTPHEAGMTLLREPRAPRPSPYALFLHCTPLEDWRPYIPWLS
ncbi:MAG: HNH endonuclease [Chloroflexi bacterium]|nr:HNH endonuclease [Chloroflexota bacterium]